MKRTILVDIFLALLLIIQLVYAQVIVTLGRAKSCAKGVNDIGHTTGMSGTIDMKIKLNGGI